MGHYFSSSNLFDLDFPSLGTLDDEDVGDFFEPAASGLPPAALDRAAAGSLDEDAGFLAPLLDDDDSWPLVVASAAAFFSASAAAAAAATTAAASSLAS